MNHHWLIASWLLIQAASPSRPPAKTADLGKKEAALVPEKGLAGDITRKKKVAEKERPTLQYDQFQIGLELQVASKRREQIETLRQIIKLGAPDTEMPGLLFRLGELFWEEARFHFFEANRKDDEIIAAKSAGNKAALAKAEAEKKQLVDRSEAYGAEAMARYKEIVQRYPKYERMDEVLFFLGKNLMERGQEKPALTAYQRLITAFPKSKYVADAWVAFGEFYFNSSKGQRDKLQRALESYKKAATFTESNWYGFSLYKQSWCYYNLGDFKAAMEMLKTVIFYGDVESGLGSKENKNALVREARKDYVLAYSHVGDPVAARAEFKKVGGDESYFSMLKGLAGLYYDEGKDKEAVLVYRTLIQDKPRAPEAAFFQGRIVDCVLRVGNKKITVEQVRELARIMKEVDRTGSVKTDADRATLKDAKELSERILSKLAVDWHNEAKKTRDENTFLLADMVYGDYLDMFSDNAKAYDLRFFRAELLNDNLERFDRAAEEYTRVLLTDINRVDPPKDKSGRPQHPPMKPGRFMANAAYNAVLAYDEVAKKFEQSEQLPKSAANQKLAFPPAKLNLLKACERYLKYLPSGDKRVEIAYKAANIYYRYNYFEDAVQRFADIALNHPENELAEYSANLILDSYNIQEKWEKVNEWAHRFAKLPKLGKPKFREDLGRILEQSSFKLVNLLEQRADFASAADHYLEFVKEFPRSDLADKALLNASVDYFKAKLLDKAVAVRRRLVEGYPESPFVPAAIFANGEAYEAMGDFADAAGAYEMYAFAFQKQRGGGEKAERPRGRQKGKKAAAKTDEPRRPGSGGKFEESKAQAGLFNAGIFRQGLGQYKEAERDRQAHLDMWPGSKDAEAVFLSIADLYEKERAYPKMMAHLEDYERRYGLRDPDKLLSAELRIARAFEKLKDKKSSQRIYGRILTYYEKLPKNQRKLEGGAEAVARAHLLDTDSMFDAYAAMGISLVSAPDLAKSLKAKGEKLVELQKGYTETVNFKVGDPAICALYRIGLGYDNLARMLSSAPVDSAPLPPEATKKFRQQVNKQLGPLAAVIDKPYKRWPAQYKEAVTEQQYDDLKKQLDDASQQLKDAYHEGIRTQLAEQVVPTEQKAAEAFALAVDKSRELSLFNDCARQALKLLGEKYRPEKYPPALEAVAELSSAAPPRLGAGLLGSLQAAPATPVTRAQRSEETREEPAVNIAPTAEEIEHSQPPPDPPQGAGGRADEPGDEEPRE